MASAIDTLAAHEEWKSTILPRLQQLLKKNAKPEEMFEWAQSYAAAEMISLALTEEDAGKRLVAVKDILDRHLGKAKERTEVEHKFSRLKDEELDAVLLSKAQEVEATSGDDE